MIISLIAASLIIEPKSRYFMKFHKLNIFLIGTFILILSQLGLKFFLISVSMTILIILLPIILISIYYLLLFIITKFKFNYL